MAELAAIGLASNVLQFADVAIKLFIRARHIHESVKGTTEEAEDLEVSLVGLERIADSLQSSIHQFSATSPSNADERNLMATASKCNSEAKVLLGQLEQYKVTSDSGIRRRWESFKLAMVASDSKLKEHQTKFEKCQRDLLLGLAAVMNNKQTSTIRAITKLQQNNSDLQADTVRRLDALTHEIIAMLQSHNQNDAADNIVDRLNSIDEEVASVRKKQEILRSLCFPSIRARVSAIKKEHKDTFEWAFRPERCTFATWLREGADTYFICGKTGSGKSTLMKFLAEHERTQTALQTWAGHQTLVIASHYFWNSGSPMQKSQEGLIQTLLYQVLRQCPHLIPTVCTSRWANIHTVDIEDWSADELLSSLDILSRQTHIPVKFAFFIDGLDEFTGGADRYRGTYQELIGPIKQLAQSDSIRVCVSSRPWTEFELAFGKSEFRLKLEDLTRDDVRHYVQDTLWSDSNFAELAAEDPRCSTLIDAMTQRAKGVFLWVFLVVSSLVRGLTASDNFEDLQKRLNELPDDLEDFFRHMLRTIEPVYWDHTVRFLQITIYTRHTLPIAAYELLDQEKRNPDFALASGGETGFYIPTY
ncbi:hypothetical protein PG988_007401 [Apiospora saccharicola]